MDSNTTSKNNKIFSSFIVIIGLIFLNHCSHHSDSETKDISSPKPETFNETLFTQFCNDFNSHRQEDQMLIKMMVIERISEASDDFFWAFTKDSTYCFMFATTDLANEYKKTIPNLFYKKVLVFYQDAGYLSSQEALKIQAITPLETNLILDNKLVCPSTFENFDPSWESGLPDHHSTTISFIDPSLDYHHTQSGLRLQLEENNITEYRYIGKTTDHKCIIEVLFYNGGSIGFKGTLYVLNQIKNPVIWNNFSTDKIELYDLNLFTIYFHLDTTGSGNIEYQYENDILKYRWLGQDWMFDLKKDPISQI